MISAFNLGALYDPDLGGDNPALIDCRDWRNPRTLSHRQIEDAANAFARGIRSRGLSPGEAVGLLSANRSEFLIAYLGCLRAGLVAVPINYRFPAETIAYILDDAAVRLVLCDDERRGALPEGAACCGFDDSGPDGYAALLDPGAFEVFRPGPDDVAMVLYTSGSTGRPKGVPLTHEGHLWALRGRMGNWPYTHHRLLIAAPLYHMNALCTGLFALSASASAVLMPEFDARHYLQAIERFGCTWITSVPTMLAMAFMEEDLLARLNLSSVSVVRMGSAPISPRLWQRVKEVFPGAGLMNGYGTTEAGPIVFGPRKGQAPPDLSVGWVQPDVDVRLVDADGRDAEEGVLWHRTPATMTGYLNLPEKTAEALTDDGWYISGDVFRRDADGAYYFVGRSDDMFVCGGENIYPGEVEGMLVGHADIEQACVVPVPDEIKGMKPVAFVVPRPGATVRPEAVKAHALAHGPAYQHPRLVVVVDSLPLAGPGKIDRKALRRRAEVLWNAENAPAGTAGG